MKTSLRTIAAVLAGGLLLAFAPLTPATAQVTSAAPLRVSENTRLGAEPGVARGRDVPGLAVNPTNPDHIVEVDVDYINGECDFKTTLDGGKTWSGDHLRGPAGFPVPPCNQNFDSGGYAHGNASVVFGSGQNVYTAFSSHRGPFQRPESLIIAGEGDDSLVARSTDGGRTFQTATVGLRGGPDAQPFFIRPQVAVEPGAGAGGADRVYVAGWACRVTTGGCSGGQDIRKMIVARSDDGGVTWGAPVEANRPNEQMREPGQPVVAADGSIYIVWRNRDTALPTTAPQPPNYITVARSTDRGATWTHVDINGSTGNGGHPRIAIDKRNGNLYVTYIGTDFSGGTEVDMVFQRSVDRGQTWSTPIRINDDPVGNRVDQRNPWVSVSPDGKVNVVWMDPRHANNPTSLLSCCPQSAPSRGLGDIYTATSTDGGVSFGANHRVTDRSFNRDVGLIGVGGYTWYGAVSTFLDANRIMFAWTDMREGNFHNGSQDVYKATMDVRGGGAIPVDRLPVSSTTGLSASISQLAYPGGLEAAGNPGPIPVTKVVIVPEDSPGLALAGSVLARGNFGPLLASPAARLSEEVRAEVRRMEPIGAYVVGGEPLLTAGVIDDLVGAGIPRSAVVRIAGATDADTARLVAEAMDNRTDALRAAGTPPFDSALIVNPASTASTAVAALAASARQPVLFTEGAGTLPAATRNALTNLAIPSTAVVGDATAVADSVIAQLPGFAGRLNGNDAATISEAATAQLVARGFPTNQVFVSDSNRPVDGAVLGAAVARIGGLHLVVPGADASLAQAALGRLNLTAGVDEITVALSSGLAGDGYRLVAADGGIFAFGSRFLGSLGGTRLNRPVVANATTASGKGYYLVASDGGVFSFGDAVFHGSTGAIRLNQPIVGMAPTPTGKGYWLVASDGGVFAFGDAVFQGSTGAIKLNQPIVAMAATPTGRGYFLIARDGGVFAFGDAVFRGSTGAIKLNQPIVGAAATPSGQGYFLVASDGGVFAFGDAAFRGSTGAIRLARPIVGMATSPSGRGYVLAGSDGGVFAFGDAVFRGSTGGTRLASAIVGIAAS